MLKKRIFVSIMIFGMFFLSFGVSAQDLLSKAFEPALERDFILDLGETKENVGKSVTRKQISAFWNLNKGKVKRCIQDNDQESCDALEDTFLWGKILACKQEDPQNHSDLCNDLISDIFLTEEKPPLLARIAQLLLRFTIALAVSMVIYNAIMYGTKVMGGDDYKSKESLKKLIYVVVGILIALFSVVIINLMRSLATTVVSPL